MVALERASTMAMAMALARAAGAGGRRGRGLNGEDEEHKAHRWLQVPRRVDIAYSEQ